MIKLLVLTLLFITPLTSTFAQGNKTGGSIYRSTEDDLLTIRSIAVLPVIDNLRGIYSRPIEKHLIDLVEKNHHWDLADSSSIGPILSPEDLEASPESVRQLSQGLNADAFLAARVSKGPNGITIKMDLFLTKDSKLLAQESVSGYKRFEVAAVKEKVEKVLSTVLKKIPYNGIVMSRKGNRVTLNLGRNDGVSKDQMISVVQVIKVTRHPKFNFLVSTEKEILGKVRLLKVDDTLSFGRIVTERERGAIQVASKVSGLDFVSYSNSGSLTENTSENDALMQRPDGKMTFGEKALAWLPKRPPTFGRVGARLGIANYTSNVSTTTSNLNMTAPWYPNIALDGELWLTPKWTLHAELRQGIISTNNPSAGSDLSSSLSGHELLAGYTMRFGPSVWGPKVEILGGWANYKLSMDSTTTALTTKSYSGLKGGVMGSYPVSKNRLWSLGAKLFFIFNAGLNESPGSSGSDDNEINQFGIFVDRKLSENIKATGALDFELYSSSFSGGTVRSSTQRHTGITTGLSYMF